MNEKSSFAVGMLLIIAAMTLGFWLGASAMNGGWERDCFAIGAHRTGADVYTCRPVAK